LKDGGGVERAASRCWNLFCNDAIEVFAGSLCRSHHGEVGNEVVLASRGNVLELLAGSVGDVFELQRFSDAAGNLSRAGTVALAVGAAR